MPTQHSYDLLLLAHITRAKVPSIKLRETLLVRPIIGFVKTEVMISIGEEFSSK